MENAPTRWRNINRILLQMDLIGRLSSNPPSKNKSGARVGAANSVLTSLRTGVLHFAVDMALSAVSDPSGDFLASTATWSPAARVFETSLSSVTGVLGGTVTF